MKISTATDFESVPPWESLLSEQQKHNPFLRREWLTTWWRTLGQGELMIVLAHDEELAGFAPLFKHEGTIRFAGYPMSDFMDIVGSHDARREILKYLRSYKHVILEEIPEQSETLSIGRKNGGSVFFTNECVSLDTRTHENFQGAVKKRDIVRHERKLHALGNVTLERIPKDRMAEHLETYFEFHRKAWKEKGNPSKFEHKKYCDFFRELAQTMPVCMYALLLDDKPIAYRFCFMYGDTCSLYSTTYDITYAADQPGLILLAKTLEDIRTRGCSRFDFMRGVESYKLRFANESFDNYGIAFIKNPARRAIFLSGQILKERIMRNRKLHKFTIELRQKMRKAIT